MSGGEHRPGLEPSGLSVRLEDKLKTQGRVTRTLVTCTSVVVEVQDRLPPGGSCGTVNHQRTLDAIQKECWQFYVISRSAGGKQEEK